MREGRASLSASHTLTMHSTTAEEAATTWSSDCGLSCRRFTNINSLNLRNGQNGEAGEGILQTPLALLAQDPKVESLSDAFQ